MSEVSLPKNLVLKLGWVWHLEGKWSNCCRSLPPFHLKSWLTNQAHFSYLLINLLIWICSQEVISRYSLMTLLSMENNLMFSSHHVSKCLISALTGFQQNCFSNFQLKNCNKRLEKIDTTEPVSLPWGMFTYSNIVPKNNVTAETQDILQSITFERFLARAAVLVLHAYIFF